MHATEFSDEIDYRTQRPYHEWTRRKFKIETFKKSIILGNYTFEKAEKRAKEEAQKIGGAKLIDITEKEPVFRRKF
ncbi:MAG: hypothetical protein ABIG60_03380 [Patescibacteria group bacterium]